MSQNASSAARAFGRHDRARALLRQTPRRSGKSGRLEESRPRSRKRGRSVEVKPHGRDARTPRRGNRGGGKRTRTLPSSPQPSQERPTGDGGGEGVEPGSGAPHSNFRKNSPHGRKRRAPSLRGRSRKARHALLDNERRRLGPGLVIVQSIAEAHRAKLLYRAREAGGLSVCLDFPPFARSAPETEPSEGHEE